MNPADNTPKEKTPTKPDSAPAAPATTKVEEVEAEETSSIPTVDPNATLKIEEVKKSDSDIPETNLKASLKVEEVEEDEEENTQEKSNKILFIIGGVILGIIVLSTVGFFVFSSREPKENVASHTEKASKQSEATPAAVVRRTLKRSDWRLEVLNGSGISGLAKKAADKLGELGYEIVKTGNADKSNYKTTMVIIASDRQVEESLFLEDLGKIFEGASSSGELKDSTASARIIVGKEGFNP